MRVFKCNHCSRLHLEIGNTQIHFATLNDLNAYLARLEAVDVDYYAAVNRKKGLTKVIILPLDDSNSIQLGFTVREFEALKKLIREYLSNGRKPSVVDLNNFQAVSRN